jgi:hypothetical protein
MWCLTGQKAIFVRQKALMNQKMCDQGLLNRFFDEELGPGEHAHITEHLKACQACQRVLRENQALSDHLRGVLDEELSHADLERVQENVLAHIRRKEIPWRTRLRDLLVSKRFFVPATATVAILVLFLTLFRHPSSVPGPSAIVSSVEGDVASVMILETPESHQTIVWISENLISGEEDNGNKEDQSSGSTSGNQGMLEERHRKVVQGGAKYYS